MYRLLILKAAVSDSFVYWNRLPPFQIYAKDINSSDFLDLLTHDELVSTIENTCPDYRKNIYTPMRTLLMFLAQSLNEDRPCKEKILLSLVTQLTTKIADLVYQQAVEDWHWNGKHVHLIDGTTLTMPDTPENQQTFPQ